MKNLMYIFFTLLFLSTISLNAIAQGDCDYQNEEWLNDRLTDESLCDACISEVNVYVLNDTTYIGFIADNNNCTDAITTIYYCDGTQFCLDGGIAGFQQCNDWYAQGPTLVETLWVKSLDCACNCFAIFEPVCGTNGITYTNSCFAECDGQFDYVDGECNTSGFTCDWEDLVWLDSILQTPNLCQDCIRAVDVYELRDTTFIAFLADNVNCADALTTVFTCDFEVYCLNEGFAGFTECEDLLNDPDLLLVENIWNFEEDCGCICPTIFQPVCGSDGITYGNSCEAECAGITEYEEGECDPNGVEDLVYQDWQISRVTPNPTSDVLHIAFSSVEKSLVVEVYNALGVLVQKMNLGQVQGSAEVTLDMGDLVNGVYFLSFKTEKEQRGIRVVKQ